MERLFIEFRKFQVKILKGKSFRLDSGLDHASQVAKEARTQTQA